MATSLCDAEKVRMVLINSVSVDILFSQETMRLIMDVDDLSDGEGDEEEAERQRVAMEIREDNERTQAVIAAVMEGRAVRAAEELKGIMGKCPLDKYERAFDSNVVFDYMTYCATSKHMTVLKKLAI